jgi:adenylate kinase family enzyme
VNNLKLKEDDTYLIEDYINYIGIWNDDKIFNNELKGYKYDIKTIKPDLPFEYEPTEHDIEDITLPTRISDNYTFGNTILNLIDTKYSSNKENEISKDSINKENTNSSKWNYIPYKLSLIGYPLSGRKFIAENLNKKYPNLKIYSIKKIFRDYYIEYKTLTEDIDNNPKYKSLKPNQITQMKEEREKQLSEFTPILDIIKPFIDFINEEKIKKRLEEERIKREKEKMNNENKGPKGAKSQVKRGSIAKKKNTVEVPEVKEENINDDLSKIPSDEVLFNLLKYQIEKDFPKKAKEQENNEIIENQKKIFQILSNIENIKKQKKEAAKPNPKDDATLNNLQKDLENIKLDSIKGFILVDYPSNLNQGILLENYLTGYVDEIKKPKSEKNIVVNNLSNLLDFKIMPKKNNVFKRAGIDFIINIISQEKDINERFQSKKYDPVSDKIYTHSDLTDENKNKQPLDKKIVERLVNDVPYLTNENFDYYKDEYNTNIGSICSLYNKFGMYVDVSSAQDPEINVLGIDITEKELKKAFQSIDLDTNDNKDKNNIMTKKLEAAKIN